MNSAPYPGDRSPMFVAHHFDHHSTTNHPTSPSSDPFPCSLSPTGSVLDGLGFAHSQQSRQLAWPNRVHLRCGLGVSHSVAPDHASRHRPYFVLLVLSRFNYAGLSPALIRAPWRTGTGVLARRWSLDIWKTEIVLRRSKIFIATGIQIAVSSVGAAYYG